MLNKPCTQPNFVEPFKIKVIDDLSANTLNKNNFSVSMMVENLFKTCFRIETSEDPKEEAKNEPKRPQNLAPTSFASAPATNCNENDEIEIIASNVLPHNSSISVQTPVSANNNLRGNRQYDLTCNHGAAFSHTHQTQCTHAYSSHPQPCCAKAQNPYSPSLQTVGDVSSSHNHSLNHLNYMTNSIARQNAINIPQTGNINVVPQAIGYNSAKVPAVQPVSNANYVQPPPYRTQVRPTQNLPSASGYGNNNSAVGYYQVINFLIRIFLKYIFMYFF